MNLFKVIFALTGVIFLMYFLLVKVEQAPSNSDASKNLKVYCAIGMKAPFEKAAKEFEKLYSVKISAEFRGSGHLVGPIKLNPVGDLFIAADSSYTTILKNIDIVKETLPLAEMYPIIAVQKGNPKGIKSLDDLKRNDIKVVLANSEAASIGHVTQKILEQTGDWDAISKNTINHGVFKPTVTEIANDIKLKVMDATIIWDAIAKQKEFSDHLEVIEIDALKANKEQVTIGVLVSSKNPTLALKFARFLHAKEKGQKYFTEEGFKGISNADEWNDKPTISIFSGGVNRKAIEKTIEEFQKREGVSINTTYNGCGILIGQMKAGSKPDAYFACDASFMTQVNNTFEYTENLSQTNIVIVVKKDNPLKIKSLEDLEKPGIKIGVGHPEQSALGSLTKRLLESKGLYEKIKPNISAETPSADMIVAQFKAGSLDVCLVYKVNINFMKDEIEIININDEKANAVQPFGIANYSNNHYLLERFLEALKNNSQNFTFAGFNYIGKKNSLIKLDK